MNFKVLLSCCALLQCLQFYAARRTKEIIGYGQCKSDQYRCRNEKCIKKSWFCDGNNDCGDNSDESYCHLSYGSASCPQHYSFFQCSLESYRIRCIPEVWHCDGVIDCPDGNDESVCLDDVEKIFGVTNARKKAATWLCELRHNTTGNGKWGSRAPRIAMALYLSDSNFFNGTEITGNEIAYEVDIQVLSSILRNESQVISANELALYIHALLVTCINVRDFHGVDLVANLRHRVDTQTIYTSPLVLLALCNAKDTMTHLDVHKLIYAFQLQERHVWTDIKALSLIALSCIAELHNGPYVNQSSITSMSLALKSQQHSNGSFGNLQTTALVMQALFSSGREEGGWDMDEAVKFLVKNQDSDGSYGNFLNTYFVLPVLHYKSLLNISSAHCMKPTEDTVTDVLDDLNKRPGAKIVVKYSLWLGNEVDLIRTLEIRVVENSTFFYVMDIAKSLDEKYKFEYNLLNAKPYVRMLSGYQDDPENEKFWFLYKANSTGYASESINLSPIEVIPKNNEEYIMWYKTGHWAWNHPQILAEKIKMK